MAFLFVPVGEEKEGRGVGVGWGETVERAFDYAGAFGGDAEGDADGALGLLGEEGGGAGEIAGEGEEGGCGAFEEGVTALAGDEAEEGGAEDIADGSAAGGEVAVEDEGAGEVMDGGFAEIEGAGEIAESETLGGLADEIEDAEAAVEGLDAHAGGGERV